MKFCLEMKGYCEAPGSICARVRFQSESRRVTSEFGLARTQHPPVLHLTLGHLRDWTVTILLHHISSIRPEVASANAARPSLHCSNLGGLRWMPRAKPLPSALPPHLALCVPSPPVEGVVPGWV